jgi:TolB-like protein
MSTVRFGEFEFDPLAGELRRSGETTRLEPQPARVLAVLVERAGEVVSRDELQQRVWAATRCRLRARPQPTASRRSARRSAIRRPSCASSRRCAARYRFIAAQPDAAPAFHRSPGAAAFAVAARALRSPARLVDADGAAPPKPLAPAADTRVRRRRPFDNETDVAACDRLAQTLTDATVARLAAMPIAWRSSATRLSCPRMFRDVGVMGSLGVSHVVLGQVQEISGQLRITTRPDPGRRSVARLAQRFEPSAADTVKLDRRFRAVTAAVTGARWAVEAVISVIDVLTESRPNLHRVGLPGRAETSMDRKRRPTCLSAVPSFSLASGSARSSEPAAAGQQGGPALAPDPPRRHAGRHVPTQDPDLVRRWGECPTAT